LWGAEIPKEGAGWTVKRCGRCSSHVGRIVWNTCRIYAVACAFRSWPRVFARGQRTGHGGRPPTPAPGAQAPEEFHPPAGDVHRRRVTAHPRPARARPNGSPSPFIYLAAYRTRPGRVPRIHPNHRNPVKPRLVNQNATESHNAPEVQQTLPHPPGLPLPNPLLHPLEILQRQGRPHPQRPGDQGQGQMMPKSSAFCFWILRSLGEDLW